MSGATPVLRSSLGVPRGALVVCGLRASVARRLDGDAPSAREPASNARAEPEHIRQHPKVQLLVGIILLMLTLTASLGCTGDPAGNGPRRDYVRPDDTLTLAELVERLNQNNGRIASLYAEGDFEANLREARDQPNQFVNGEIVALYLAPERMRLKGKKGGVGDVFDLGSNGERFWMYLPTEKHLATGTFAGMDPETARQLPVRPDLVLQVLGITALDRDLLATPAPMLRVNPDSDAYMLTWAEPVEGPPARWNVVREVWYDRKTLQPTLVILFDAHGDPVLRAYLSRHKPIGQDGATIASRYDLYFPETGSTMWLDFGRLHLRNPQNPRFPREGSFNPPRADDVPNVVDLDEPVQRRES